MQNEIEPFKLLAESRLFLILLALMVVLNFLSDRFLTADNLTNVLWSACLIGIMTTGAIYAPITGGIDLSIGPRQPHSRASSPTS